MPAPRRIHVQLIDDAEVEGEETIPVRLTLSANRGSHVSTVPDHMDFDF